MNRLFPWIISYPNPFMTLLLIALIITIWKLKIETIHMLKHVLLNQQLDKQK
jgi:hypothetical protein